jgi:hypothetical protein
MRAYSKANRKTKTDHQCQLLRVKTLKERYGEDYFNKISLLAVASIEKYGGYSGLGKLSQEKQREKRTKEPEDILNKIKKII